MPDNKIKYKELCQKENLCLFFQDWWLDAVCGPEGWDVVLVEKGGGVIASLPFYKMKKLGYKFLIKPKLTPYLGPWIKYPEGQKLSTRLSFEKSTYNELLDLLPPYDFFYQDFHYATQNWLPFYWKGFQETTIYSYIIEDLSDADQVYQQFDNHLKRSIKKAQKELEVYRSDDIKLFYELNQQTFDRQKKQIPYSLSFIEKMDKACQAHQAREIFFARDHENNVHAGLYLVWDKQSAYFLMGGARPEFRNSGANSLLFWEAIKFSATVTQKFDFEGGLIEAIEKFFRSFGAKQVPYHRISKTKPFMLKCMKFFLQETGLDKKIRRKV